MKLKVTLLVFSLFVFMGCAESELALKEKCAKYLETEKMRYSNNESEDIGLMGIFYSKAKNTCVSIWFNSNRYYFTYYDVLTSESIQHIPSWDDLLSGKAWIKVDGVDVVDAVKAKEDAENFEKTLLLVK